MASPACPHVKKKKKKRPGGETRLHGISISHHRLHYYSVDNPACRLGTQHEKQLCTITLTQESPKQALPEKQPMT